MKKVLFLDVIGVLVIFLMTITSQVAQPPIPIPVIGGRGEVDLLINGGFETDTNTDKIPDGWIGINTSTPAKDKLICNQPTKPVAHTGNCAFMFKGNLNGSLSKLQQTITDPSLIVDRADVTFSVYLDTRNAVPNTKIGFVKINYSNGAATKLTLRIPALRGVDDYQLVSDTETIDLPIGVTVTKVKVDFRYSGVIGKFVIDDAGLVVITADATATPSATSVPTDLPTQTPTVIPSETGTAEATPTATATDTETGTASPTATPTDAATTEITPSPTDTPTNTATITSMPTDTVTPTITATNTPISPVTTLIANDGEGGDSFGFDVAVEGDTLVVGAYGDDIGDSLSQGSAYVFVWTGSAWIQQQKLTAGGAFAGFGRRVAISGDTIAINGFYATYIYVRNGTNWTLQQQINNSYPSVAIDGDTLVIGAPNSAAVYVYVRDNAVWTLQQTITPSENADTFGYAVALESDTLVVGAPYADSGLAYVFTRSGTVWTEQQPLVPNTPTFQYGWSVDVSGDTIIVGMSAMTGDSTPIVDGTAFVFTKNGTTWTHTQSLSAPIDEPLDVFGYSVAVDGDTLVVGAWLYGFNSIPQHGAAYLYGRSGAGNPWVLQQKVNPNISDWEFGFAVALDFPTLIVGHYLERIGNYAAGAVWVYALP